MHPTARILCWLVLLATTQVLSATGCLAGFALALTQGKMMLAHWWKLLRRSRILLISLWLIIAYSLPGDTWRDYAWIPSHPGLVEANLHAARLVLLLASLAWLLSGLHHRELVAALWQLMHPLQQLGINLDRTAVRLALVLEYLEQSLPKTHWRDLATPLPELPPGNNTLSLSLPAWNPRDLAHVFLGATLALLLSQL